MRGPDGADMTDEEKLADYDRMKSLYNRMLRGIGPADQEELDFQVSLTLLSSGEARLDQENWPKFIDHINAYRARIAYLEKEES